MEIPISELSSFQYSNGSYARVGIVAGLGVDGMLALLGGQNAGLGAKNAIIQVPLIFSALGGVLGLLSKKEIKIDMPEKHFAHHNEILIDLKFASHGIGFVISF